MASGRRPRSCSSQARWCSARASSDAFLQAVQPKVAYIEAGLNNSYGLPTQAALSRLQAIGAKIYRTDQDGTQEYTIAPRIGGVPRPGDRVELPEQA